LDHLEPIWHRLPCNSCTDSPIT